MNYYPTKYLHDTGKTAAFLLPILHKILDDGFEESCAGNPKCFIDHRVFFYVAFYGTGLQTWIWGPVCVQNLNFYTVKTI